jgi:[ribosomal protein S5]-alanine N-acetyltransferase
LKIEHFLIISKQDLRRGCCDNTVGLEKNAIRKLMDHIPILHTRRLLLRPYSLADAPEVQRLAGDFAIADTTASIPHPYPDGAAAEWIGTHQGLLEGGKEITFAVVLKETDALAGSIGLHNIAAAHEHAELGYWIGVPYWGKGYCTEAAQAVIDYVFSGLGFRRIYAHYFKRNPASGRVMEKCGMSWEGCLRQHIKRWDKFEDVIEYGILKEEWLAIQKMKGAQ